MFEDQQQPKPVEDIFDKVDKNTAPVPGAQPAMAAPVMEMAPAAAAAGGSKMGMIAIIVAIVAVLGVGGYFGYYYLMALSQKPPAIVDFPVSPQQPAATETPSAAIPAVVEQAPLAVDVAQFDTDKDGWTDAEEIKLGTNPNKVDTDADGLFDYDEVNVYKTNPLKSDTDGDSFLDGQEVLNGYNPNGQGKLLDFDKAKAELTK